MPFERPSTNGASAQAEELIRELNLLRRITNRREELRQRIAAYEERYQLRSEDVHSAIDGGRLDETEEVCDWIMDYELLQRTAP